jgi:hypothetical protein
VGQIPLSSTSALEARGSRPNIVNNFSARRASAFEGVKGESLRATAIQKKSSVHRSY